MDAFFVPLKKNKQQQQKKRKSQSERFPVQGKRPKREIEEEKEEEEETTNSFLAATQIRAPQEKESTDERRVRMAREYLEKMKDEISQSNVGDTNEEIELKLQQEANEATGRAFHILSTRLKNPGEETSAPLLLRAGHKESVTSVVINDNGSAAFSGSKDGTIAHWDVETNTRMSSYPKFTRHTGKGHEHTAKVLCLSLSTDGKLLASAGEDKKIHIWDTTSDKEIGTLSGHRDFVTALSFRRGTKQLFSGSMDRTVKVWNAESMSYIETLFGHQSSVTCLDCLEREHVISSGSDSTIRLWKVPEESQLVFHGGHVSSIETASLISDNSFLAGGTDGAVSLWVTSKKSPIDIRRDPHGSGNWITAVASCKRSDIAASASSNGFVQLWSINRPSSDESTSTTTTIITAPKMPRLKPLYQIQGCVGFVNSLAFSSQGEILAIGIGQEHKMGSWSRNKDARNGVMFVRLSYTD